MSIPGHCIGRHPCHLGRAWPIGETRRDKPPVQGRNPERNRLGEFRWSQFSPGLAIGGTPDARILPFTRFGRPRALRPDGNKRVARRGHPSDLGWAGGNWSAHRPRHAVIRDKREGGADAAPEAIARGGKLADSDQSRTAIHNPLGDIDDAVPLPVWWLRRRGKTPGHAIWADPDPSVAVRRDPEHQPEAVKPIDPGVLGSDRIATDGRRNRRCRPGAWRGQVWR